MTFGSIPLGWMQLKHQKFRLMAATMGITFAVVLICVQLEFREALFVSAVRYQSAMELDLVMISPKTDFMIAAKQFPRNRLFQVQGLPEIKSVTPVYVQIGSWRNPRNLSSSRDIFIVGFDPQDHGFARIITPEQHQQIKIPDNVLFDQLGRPEYGPIASLVGSGDVLETEINNRRVDIVGLFSIGTSFGIDGGIITSDLNFRRLFPQRSESSIDMGLIHLVPGSDPINVQQLIRQTIPPDVQVLTAAQLKQLEIDYWNKTTPIGYIFTFGAIMGLVVGVIIVYQILYSDVQDHLQEYATLKAMGYSHSYLRNVVLQQSVILAILGFMPGIAVSMLIFSQAAEVTRLPLEMDIKAATFILFLTVVMCAGSGMLALRRLKSIDPAEVF